VGAHSGDSAVFCLADARFDFSPTILIRFGSSLSHLPYTERTCPHPPRLSGPQWRHGGCLPHRMVILPVIRTVYRPASRSQRGADYKGLWRPLRAHLRPGAPLQHSWRSPAQAWPVTLLFVRRGGPPGQVSCRECDDWSLAVPKRAHSSVCLLPRRAVAGAAGRCTGPIQRFAVARSSLGEWFFEPPPRAKSMPGWHAGGGLRVPLETQCGGALVSPANVTVP